MIIVVAPSSSISTSISSRSRKYFLYLEEHILLNASFSGEDNPTVRIPYDFDYFGKQTDKFGEFKSDIAVDRYSTYDIAASNLRDLVENATELYSLEIELEDEKQKQDNKKTEDGKEKKEVNCKR